MTEETPSSVRRICLAIDARGYSSAGDHRQAAFQNAIASIMKTAATKAGLDRASWVVQHTGDGEVSVLPEHEKEARVVDDFVRHVVTELRRFNADRVDQAHLRLRMSVHYGRLSRTATGFAGPTPVQTVRLLDSALLRKALADNARSALALIVSDGVFRDNVAPGHTTLHPRDFRKVRVTEKEFTGDAWIWISPPEPAVAGAGGGETSTESDVHSESSTSYIFHGPVTNRGDHTTFGPRS